MTDKGKMRRPSFLFLQLRVFLSLWLSLRVSSSSSVLTALRLPPTEKENEAGAGPTTGRKTRNERERMKTREQGKLVSGAGRRREAERGSEEALEASTREREEGKDEERRKCGRREEGEEALGEQRGLLKKKATET